jgi:ubiquinone/menaquinone biosynthesis C-methylase UbiE
MAREGIKFSGEDAANYDFYLGPLLFEPSAREFISHLRTKDIQSVLEVSCGTGRLTSHLRNYFPETTKIIASDISADMLTIAKEKMKDSSVEFQIANAQALPFTDESFDLVINQYGLMFLPDKQKGFDEAFRVLKHGGRFIFATWDKSENIPLFHLIFNEMVIPQFKEEDTSRFQTPFVLYDSVQLEKYLENAGFSNMEVFHIHFKSGQSTAQHVVDGYFLKHALGRELANENPEAVAPLAKEILRQIVLQFGETDVVFDLKAFIGIGYK